MPRNPVRTLPSFALLLAVLLSIVARLAVGSPPGLIAQYRLEKIEAGAVAEETAQWPGRVEGEVKQTPGRAGQAIQLDGKGFIRVPGSQQWSLARGLSVEAWICPERLAAGRIVDRSTPGTSDSFCLDTHPGDSIRFITPAGTVSALKVLAPGKWTHVVAVYDPDAAEVAIYLEGKLAACQPAGRTAATAGPNAVCIGADTAGGNRFFGKIDEVRIYAAALDNEGVAARLAGKEPRILPAEEAAGPILYRDGPHLELSALSARNDLVYLSPALHEHEALPIGNGRLCAMVWNADGLNLQLNHANNVFHQNASGRVRLRAKPGLLDRAEQFSQRLSLYDGTVWTRCRSAAGDWQAAATVLDGSDVIALRIEGKLRGAELSLDIEHWRPAAKPVAAGDTAGFVEDLPAPAAPSFSRKMAILARADCPASLAPAQRENDAQVLTLTLKPNRGADGQFAATIYIANPMVAADANPETAARALLDRAVQAGWKPLADQAARRWAQFWEKSFVHLRSPDGGADYMENLWHLHLYWMGCGGDGDLAIKFNGGPFLVHRDSRSWGTSYWYQNTREPYWALPAANHLELCRGLERLYLSTLPAHRKLARELFGKRGLQVQETMAITGEGDKQGNPYTMLYLSTGLECALQLYRQAAFARDDDRLRREVLPFIGEAVEFYRDYATQGPDGRWHILPEDGRETYWRVQDGMNSIAALRAALPVLLRESQRLGMYAAERPQWQSFLDRLAPLPERPGGKTYAPCVVPPQIPASDNPVINRLYPKENTSTSLEKRFNSENVELDVVYPFGQAGIGTQNLEKAIATFHGRVFQSSYGWDWAPVCAARLGLSDEAARLQAEHCRNTQHWPQGFWDSPATAFWAGGLVDCPYFDSPGVNTAATAEMLLQSHDGLIRVWPAVPASWSGAYRLRAETGFMVVSERSGGEVRYVAVESLFGDRCRIASPWTDAWRVLSVGREVAKGAGQEIAFPTEKGQTYLVERAAAPVAAMPFAPLKPLPNTDVKYMANPRRSRRTLAPAPGMPMLGITRDGLTVPRVVAGQNRARVDEAVRAVVGEKTAKKDVRARWLDAQDKPNPAPWLCDGVVGAATIPLPRVPALGYLLELPAPAKLSAVVWSYDREGGRYDGNTQVREVRVEASADGRTWTEAARKPVHASDLHGQPVPLSPPAAARFVRLRFLDSSGRTTVSPCDEIAVYE